MTQRAGLTVSCRLGATVGFASARRGLLRGTRRRKSPGARQPRCGQSHTRIHALATLDSALAVPAAGLCTFVSRSVLPVLHSLPGPSKKDVQIALSEAAANWRVPLTDERHGCIAGCHLQECAEHLADETRERKRLHNMVQELKGNIRVCACILWLVVVFMSLVYCQQKLQSLA